MVCSGNHYHLWLILVQLLTVLLTTDCSITWFEPPPIQTVPDATNPVVTHKPNNTKLREGSINASLSWNFTLSSDVTFSSLTIFFNSVAIAGARSNGLYGVIPGSGFEEKFGFRWISSQRATLIIFNVTTAETGGLYSCQVFADKSFVVISWRSEVQVDVVTPSSIANISANQTVTEGQSITLNCTPSGYPTANPTWTRLSDNSTVTMPLINIRRQDEGGYRCTADNGIGSPATRDTYIIVHYKPDNVTLEANATENKDCSDVLWVSLTCVASEANPPVYNYQLFGNGNLPSPSGTWTQEISEKGKHDYSCLAENLLGNVTSSKNVTVTFNVPVQISADLITGSNTPRRGEDVALCCNASGFPEPTITWSKVLSNTLVEITSSKWLNFTNIKEDKSGMYICQGNNTCGKRNSSAKTIKVLHKPENVTLNASISSGKVCAPKMVKFTCKAGAAEPEVDNYALYQNDAAVANMSGSGLFTLWLNTIGHFIYLCKANNSEGTGTSNNITFTVDVPVQISANLTTGSNTPRRGEDVALYCNASGFLEPTITWSKVLSDTLVEITSSEWLNFTNIKEDKSGMYICQANNTCGKRNSSAITVKVQHKPENVTLNASISSGKVCAPKMVKFTCKAGAAEPEVDNYTLYQNDTVIANMSGSGVFTLWLNTSGHFIYLCKANNSEGTGTSNNTLMFTVEGPFSVTSVSVSPKEEVKEGEDVTLFCNVIGDPAPKVDWVDASNNVTNRGATWPLPNISRSRNGTYSCVASNACGEGNKTTTIVVQYAPGNVMLNSSSGCTEDMVQLTCEAGAANPQVERYMLYQNDTVIANMNSSGVSTLSLNRSGIFIYKCEAGNSVGSATSNNVTVEELKDVKVTLVVTNKDCKVASHVVQVKRELPDKVHSEANGHFPELECVKIIDTRCGSVIVDLVLRFSQSVSKNDVISFLKDAARNGNFGQFTVDPDSVKLTSTVKVFPSEPTKGPPSCKKSFFQNGDCSVNWLHLILIIVVAVVLIIIIAAAGGCWIHKKRKCRKDTRIACDPGSEEQRLQRDDPYAQVNNGYAETGPRSVNSREKGAAAVPDYAVVDKSAKKKKKQDEEKPPDYAVVDKSKKTKKNEKGDDTYAKVDMSKKTSKKKRKPGEEMLYADLGDFNGTSQMPTVATSPKAQAQLPPIKRPEPYEGTQYADITQFLKGDATLPIDGKQGTELKEKDEKTDEAGGENAPKETPM